MKAMTAGRWNCSESIKIGGAPKSMPPRPPLPDTLTVTPRIEEATKGTPTMPRIIRTASAVTAAAIVTGLTAVGAHAAGDETGQDYRPAIEVLETLEVAEDGDMDAYDRPARFGGEWVDADGTGCTTREDILMRDLAPETISVDGDCRVE